MEAQLRSLNKAAAEARGPDALRKFKASEDLKSARGRQRVASQNMIKAVRAQAAEQKRIADHQQWKSDNGIGSQLGSIVSPQGAAIAGITALTAAITAAVAAIGALAYKFGEASYEGAKFAQTSTKSLGYLTGSVAVGEAEFDATRKQAELLGLDVENTVGSFKKLLAAQFDLGKAHELIAMGSDLKAVVGASDDDIAGVMLAITQIKAKGRLMAQEMLQLQERGVSSELVYEALGKRLHKTSDELRKMQEAGKLTSDVALDAILAAVRKKTGTSKAGEAGEDAAKNTIAGMEAVLKAKWTNMWIDIGKTILPILTPLVKQVTSLLDEMLASEDVKQFGSDLLEQFKLFSAWVHENWPQIKGTVTDGINGIKFAFDLVVGAVKLVAEHWEFLKAVGLGLAVVLGVLTFLGFMVVAPLLLAIAVVGALIGGIVMLVQWLWTAVPAFFAWGQSVVQGVIDGIVSKFSALKETVQQLASAVSNPFASQLMINSPSKLFEQYGIYTVQGYVQGIAANDNAIKGATASMTSNAIGGAAPAIEQAYAAGSDGGKDGVHIENLSINANDEAGGRAAARGFEAELIELLDGTYG